MFSAVILALVLMGDPPKQTPEPPKADVVALKLPESVKASPGDLVIIRAETTCKRATWILPPTVKADPNEGGLKLTLVAPAGQHVLWCIVAPASDQVVVGKVLLDVAGKPDVPPVPIPPADPLAKELQALYSADAGEPGAKDAARLKLAGLYHDAAELVRDHKNTTANEFFEAVSDLAKGKVPPGVLAGMRARIAKELIDGLPADPDAQMDDAARATMQALFARLETALKALK